MRVFQAICLAAALLLATGTVSASDAGSAVTNAPLRIELRDQFDALQVLAFPTTNITLLTIADRKGSEQVAGWVAPVKQRFSGRIEIRGISDVSKVPAPLRGVVRKAFQKSQPHPVLMDWSGNVVRRFAYSPGKVEVLVLDRDGQIVQRLGGEAGDRAVQELCNAIERVLATETAQTATK